MNILVTGGAGFVGSHLIEQLLKDGQTVTSIDDYSSGFEENHIYGAEYVRLHTSEISRVFKRIGEFHTIFHLGEYSRIVPSFSEIPTVWKSNSLGTFEVLDYCRLHGVKKIVYAGSSTRFAPEGIDHSPYAYTKAKSAELIKSYNKWYGLPYAICYFYNVFGERSARRDDGYESVISVFEKQHKLGKPLTVCGNGKQRRTFTYVKDIVDGLIKAWKYGESDEFQLNFLREYTILEIAEMFGGEITFLPARPGDRSCSTTTDNKARELLNWKPTLGVDEWIKRIKES